jgi:hypothetical protein
MLQLPIPKYPITTLADFFIAEIAGIADKRVARHPSALAGCTGIPRDPSDPSDK